MLQYKALVLIFIHSSSTTALSGSGVFLGNTRRKVGIYSGWDSSPLQGTMHALIHRGINIANSPNCMFLGGGRKLQNLEETQTDLQLNRADEG